jgi:hypothetical protein
MQFCGPLPTSRRIRHQHQCWVRASVWLNQRRGASADGTVMVAAQNTRDYSAACVGGSGGSRRLRDNRPLTVSRNVWNTT